MKQHKNKVQDAMNIAQQQILQVLFSLTDSVGDPSAGESTASTVDTTLPTTRMRETAGTDLSPQLQTPAQLFLHTDVSKMRVFTEGMSCSTQFSELPLVHPKTELPPNFPVLIHSTNDNPGNKLSACRAQYPSFSTVSAQH